MANLYSDSNFYISDVTYHGGDTPSYNVIFTYTSNSVSSEFTVGADLLLMVMLITLYLTKVLVTMFATRLCLIKMLFIDQN